MKLLPLALLALGSTLSLGCVVTTREGPPPRHRATNVAPAGPARPVHVAPAAPAPVAAQPVYPSSPVTNSPPGNQPAQPPTYATPTQPSYGRPGPTGPVFIPAPERGGSDGPERAPGPTTGRPPAAQGPLARPPQPSTNGRAPATEDPGSGRPPGAIQLPDRR